MGNVHPYFSWQGKDSTPPTNAEMVANSLANADEAARLEAKARRDYEHAAPGSKEVTQAYLDVSRYRSDQRHWRDYAKYYREQVAIELNAARARDVAKAAFAARQAELEINQMPPVAVVEHPGADDDGDAWEPDPVDDERESPYAELGGAVGGAR